MNIRRLLGLNSEPVRMATGNTWLVVALGNPGKQYAETRHNAGRVVLGSPEFRVQSLEWKTDKYTNALVAKSRLGDQEIIWLQPQTFMNNSGESVRAARKQWDVSPERIIVIYDDIGLQIGKWKISVGGGDGNHNGIKSIVAQIGTPEFIRIRIGIGDLDRRMPLHDFVLSRFSDGDLQTLAEIAPDIHACISLIVQQGVVMAMNKWN